LGRAAGARGADLWLDGAHNPHAAAAVADFARSLAAADGRPVALIVGLLARKDARGVLAALGGAADRLYVAGFGAEGAASPEALAQAAGREGLPAQPFASAPAALEAELARPGPAPHVILMGSLYLAGEILGLSPETWPR
ncbi:MAG: bifunctional folylpolyglutamate synthase/dihydrofolate synthase, partial [Caulobacteraceae bacterium]|nr:bifunctional folylpolyglutamate synthase/dihydrofolate synthase [Caulobacter sp.]